MANKTANPARGGGGSSVHPTTTHAAPVRRIAKALTGGTGSRPVQVTHGQGYPRKT